MLSESSGLGHVLGEPVGLSLSPGLPWVGWVLVSPAGGGLCMGLVFSSRRWGLSYWGCDASVLGKLVGLLLSPALALVGIPHRQRDGGPGTCWVCILDLGSLEIWGGAMEGNYYWIAGDLDRSKGEGFWQCGVESSLASSCQPLQ